MKSLKTLIRLQQRELDRLRKQIAVLESHRDTMIRTIETLQDSLIQELAAANELTEMKGFFGDFSESIKKRQHAIAAKVIQLEHQIQEQMIEVTNRYSDLKKYEIAYERYLESEHQKQAKREQAELDEMGLRTHLYGDV